MIDRIQAWARRRDVRNHVLKMSYSQDMFSSGMLSFLARNGGLHHIDAEYHAFWGQVWAPLAPHQTKEATVQHMLAALRKLSKQEGMNRDSLMLLYRGVMHIVAPLLRMRLRQLGLEEDAYLAFENLAEQDGDLDLAQAMQPKLDPCDECLAIILINAFSQSQVAVPA